MTRAGERIAYGVLALMSTFFAVSLVIEWWQRQDLFFLAIAPIWACFAIVALGRVLRKVPRA